MTKTNMIYVYKKGNTRFAYLKPLSELEMALNYMELADVIQNENGIEWFSKVNAIAEELIYLMGRKDRNESIQWADYVLQGLKEETGNRIDTELIEKLEQKKVNGLNPEEKAELEKQYMLIDEYAYKEVDVYGDMHQ